MSSKITSLNFLWKEADCHIKAADFAETTGITDNNVGLLALGLLHDLRTRYLIFKQSDALRGRAGTITPDLKIEPVVIAKDLRTRALFLKINEADEPESGQQHTAVQGYLDNNPEHAFLSLSPEVVKDNLSLVLQTVNQILCGYLRSDQAQNQVDHYVPDEQI